MRIAALLTLAALLALVPSAALAQGPASGGGVVIRIDGDYTVAQGASVDRLVVINGDATIAGRAKRVVVINGDARVSGEITRHVTVARGTLDLGGTATVNDVLLIRSDLDRAAGAVVRGDIDRQGVWVWPGLAILLGLIFIFGSLFIAIAAALVMASFGGRQLVDAALGMPQRPAQSIGYGIGVAILGPIVGALLVGTVIGIPVGLIVLLIFLPMLGLLGAVTAATWLGLLILNRGRDAQRPSRPIAASLLGLALMTAVILLPAVGFVAVVLLSLWGTGALVDRAIRGTPAPPPPSAPEPRPPAPEPQPPATAA
jgi:hypothetical protein